MIARIFWNRSLAGRTLAALVTAGSVAAAIVCAGAVSAASNAVPPGSASRALIAVRFANPNLLQTNLQWIIHRMMIPKNIPTVQMLENQMAIAGGIDNSKPAYLLMLPSGATGADMEPVLILSATHPHLAVSKLNPPAPVNGISMVILNDGTTGYIALQKHAVLFATQREPLRMVLHDAGHDIPSLTGRASRLFNDSSISISMNLHRILKIEQPVFAAAMRRMSALLKANPQGMTPQQKLGLRMIKKMPQILGGYVQSMVGGIVVRKTGLAFTAMIQPPPHAKSARLIAALSQMEITPLRRVPKLPLAMALSAQMPYKMAARLAADELESIAGAGSSAGGRSSLNGDIKLYRFLSTHPDGQALKVHLFLIAPGTLSDPMEALVQDINAKHPGKVCQMYLKTTIASVVDEFKQQGATSPFVVHVIKEPTMTIDGATFTRVGLKFAMGPALKNMPRASMLASIINGMFKAMYGSNTAHIAIGHVGDRVISAVSLTPAQLRAYVNYVKGGGVSVSNSAVMTQAQKQYLPHAFASGIFDPAVLLGQLASIVNSNAGMMQKNNVIRAGQTPAWAMSASCQNGKPEFKLFVPTDSLRAGSQQIQQMLLGAMTLFMQIQHPPAGA